MILRRFLKNWRFARGYGASRRVALRLAVRSMRRDIGPSIDDLVRAYKSKEGVRWER